MTCCSHTWGSCTSLIYRRITWCSPVYYKITCYIQLPRITCCSQVLEDHVPRWLPRDHVLSYCMCTVQHIAEGEKKGGENIFQPLWCGIETFPMKLEIYLVSVENNHSNHSNHSNHCREIGTSFLHWIEIWTELCVCVCVGGGTLF